MITAKKDPGIPGMSIEQLLPEELLEALPPLLATSEEEDPIVRAKFFVPGFWRWYPIEFDGEDLFFGLVDGFELELGAFSLADLITLRSLTNGGLERDLLFKPIHLIPLRRAIEEDRRLRGES